MDSGQMQGLMTGKIALVTGGGRGLGRAIVNQLAESGAVGMVFDVLAERDVDNLPNGWFYWQGDVALESDANSAMNAVIETHGKLDVVVANAGITAPWCVTRDIDLEDWRRVFSVNVEGAAITVKLAARHMMAKGGSIVAMGSLNSWRGDPLQAAYVASKHAVLGLVRSAALDLGQHDIRINALAPGPIATDALVGRVNSRAEHGGPSQAEALQAMADATSLGRIASEADVAAACVFLASDLAKGITGQLIPVDAGLP